MLFDDTSEACLHCQDEKSGETPVDSVIYCAIFGTMHY